MDVYFNPGGSPVSIVDQVKYACWSWQTRTGIELKYIGETSSEVIPGSAVIQWVTDEWIEKHFPGKKYRGVHYRQSGGSVIKLNSKHFTGTLSDRNIRTIVHELGHAINPAVDDHLDDNHAVMYAYSSILQGGNYALSMADYLPLNISGSLDHCELTMSRDIYIPEIDGHRAILNYTGSGDSHSWKLSHLSKCPQAAGKTANKVDGDTMALTLPDVRSPGIRVSAELLWTGDDQWKIGSVTDLPL
jgi:hypothetical protein